MNPSDRLLELAQIEFERAQRALASGDRAAFQVARIAHAMIAATHRDLLLRLSELRENI